LIGYAITTQSPLSSIMHVPTQNSASAMLLSFIGLCRCDETQPICPQHWNTSPCKM